MSAKSVQSHVLPRADIVGVPADELHDLLEKILSDRAERPRGSIPSGLLAIAEAAASGLPDRIPNTADETLGDIGESNDLLPELTILRAVLSGGEPSQAGPIAPSPTVAPQWTRPAPPPARLRVPRRGASLPLPLGTPPSPPVPDRPSPSREEEELLLAELSLPVQDWADGWTGENAGPGAGTDSHAAMNPQDFSPPSIEAMAGDIAPFVPPPDESIINDLQLLTSGGKVDLPQASRAGKAALAPPPGKTESGADLDLLLAPQSPPKATPEPRVGTSAATAHKPRTTAPATTAAPAASKPPAPSPTPQAKAPDATAHKPRTTAPPPGPARTGAPSQEPRQAKLPVIAVNLKPTAARSAEADGAPQQLQPTAQTLPPAASVPTEAAHTERPADSAPQPEAAPRQQAQAPIALPPTSAPPQPQAGAIPQAPQPQPPEPPVAAPEPETLPPPPAEELTGLAALADAYIAAYRPAGSPPPHVFGDATLPPDTDAVEKLLADPPPATDFDALDLLNASWGKGAQNCTNRALLAAAYNLTRNFGLPGKLPMASSKAWRMLDSQAFRWDMANQLRTIGQFIADWQKAQKTFLILEHGEIELIENLFEALDPAEHLDLMAGVMNFKVLSNRRMGLIRRIPTRLKKQVQTLLPAGHAQALTILAHNKALLERIADPNGFAPIVDTAVKMLEEIDKLMKMAAAASAPQLPPQQPGGGQALGRIG